MLQILCYIRIVLQVNKPIHLNIKDLRNMHKQRMENYEIPYSKLYEDQVIDCVLNRIGIESHPHALEEVGMCPECDAAALLSMVE